MARLSWIIWGKGKGERKGREKRERGAARRLKGAKKVGDENGWII